MLLDYSFLSRKNFLLCMQFLFVARSHAVFSHEDLITWQHAMVDGVSRGFTTIQSLLPSSGSPKPESSPLATQDPLVWSDENFGNLTSTAYPFQLTYPVYQRGAEFQVVLSEEPFPGFDGKLWPDWAHLRHIAQGRVDGSDGSATTRLTITEWILRRDILDLCEPLIEKLVPTNEIPDLGSNDSKKYRLRLLARHVENRYCIWEDDPHLKETIATEEDQRCSSCLTGGYSQSSDMSNSESPRIDINSFVTAEHVYAPRAIITHRFQRFDVILLRRYQGSLPREFRSQTILSDRGYLEWADKLKSQVLDVCGSKIREIAPDSVPVTLNSTLLRMAHKLTLESKNGGHLSIDDDTPNESLQCLMSNAKWSSSGGDDTPTPRLVPNLHVDDVNAGYNLPVVKHDQVEVTRDPGYLIEVQFNGTRYLYKSVPSCSWSDLYSTLWDIDYTFNLTIHEDLPSFRVKALVDWYGLYGGMLLEHVDLAGSALSAECLFNCPVDFQKDMAQEIRTAQSQLANVFDRRIYWQEKRSEVVRSSTGQFLLLGFEGCDSRSRQTLDDRFNGPKRLGDQRWASTIVDALELEAQ